MFELQLLVGAAVDSRHIPPYADGGEWMPLRPADLPSGMPFPAYHFNEKSDAELWLKRLTRGVPDCCKRIVSV